MQAFQSFQSKQLKTTTEESTDSLTWKNRIIGEANPLLNLRSGLEIRSVFERGRTDKRSDRRGLGDPLA